MDLAIDDLSLVRSVTGAVAAFKNEAILIVTFIRESTWRISGLPYDVFVVVAVVLFSKMVVGGTVCGVSGARMLVYPVCV